VAARTTIDELRQQYERFGDETLEHVNLLEGLIESAGGDSHYVSPAARATQKAGAAVLESTFAVQGSIDADTAELAMLEAVMLAEAKDRHNWQLLAQLAAQMSGELGTEFAAVVAEVLAQEEEHYGWASQTRAALLMDLAGAAPVELIEYEDYEEYDDTDETAMLEAVVAEALIESELDDVEVDELRRETVEASVGDPDTRGSAPESGVDYASMTRDELYEIAKEMDIPGRSSMSKDKLIDAITERSGAR
jgi:hypothetical protein